ncbi:MAG: sensor histidine kinase [Blautia sp.]
MIILVPLLLFAAALYGFRETQSKQTVTQTETDSDGEVYDIAISQSDEGHARIHLMTKDLFLSAFIILIFTALAIGLWLYRSIATPLVKLKKATQNIKEGNLDFVLDVEGNDEFSQLCQDFEEMRRRLKESTEEKNLIEKENKELISNISHDLKTPITAVKGYVEGIMDGVADTPEKMDRYVRTIYNKTNEMDHLINELTFYSKIDTNRIPYTFSKLNVEDYFSDCAEEVGLELETKGIELVYANYVENDVVVIADGEQIRRVIHNIIGNAIKYMDKKRGIIQIRVKDVGDFIQVEIEDNGKGIGAKDLPYIFDRFYRTDISRNSSKGGSGIGLSIVKKILEDHGGKVWATSREGIGTIMYFVLRKYQEVPMK